LVEVAPRVEDRVEGAANAEASTVEYVSVDHGRLYATAERAGPWVSWAPYRLLETTQVARSRPTAGFPTAQEAPSVARPGTPV